MKALHYSDWDTLELANLDEPLAGDDEVIVRVTACGICGSELETFAKRSPRRTPPLVMGHEFCGVVETAGSSDFPVGTPVVCNAIIHCGRCANCRAGRTQLCSNRQVFGMHRPGAFAERVAAPLSCLLSWPKKLPPAWACLAEPLGNGIHVAERIREVHPRNALVVGAGSIGLMVLQAVRAILNIPVYVVDVVESRLEYARTLGATGTSLSREPDLSTLASKYIEGVGFDAVIDAAGTESTKSLTLRYVRDAGLVVWIGLGSDEATLNTYPVTLREQTVTGSYGASAADMTAALRLMEAGMVDVESWVSSYPLDHSVEAFLRQLDPLQRDVKAIIQPIG